MKKRNRVTNIYYWLSICMLWSINYLYLFKYLDINLLMSSMFPIFWMFHSKYIYYFHWDSLRVIFYFIILTKRIRNKDSFYFCGIWEHYRCFPLSIKLFVTWSILCGLHARLSLFLLSNFWSGLKSKSCAKFKKKRIFESLLSTQKIGLLSKCIEIKPISQII